MSENMSPLPKNDPLLVAWEAHKVTAEYDNSKRWAQAIVITNTREDPEQLTIRHQNLEGSLWALFVAGWNARGGDNGTREP